MNTHGPSDQVNRPRVVRPRSLMVAGALTMSGVIIAMMVDNYLDSGATEGGITRSRLWWEIVLNLQILGGGIVWFAYADVISIAEGKRRRSYIVQCCFVILSVLLPTILGAIAAWNNWFETKPSPTVYWIFVGLGIAHWFMGVLLQWSHRRKFWKKGAGGPPFFRLGEFLPFFILIVIATIDISVGGTSWLVAIPVLLYGQGAMSFVLDGFGWR